MLCARFTIDTMPQANMVPQKRIQKDHYSFKGGYVGFHVLLGEGNYPKHLSSTSQSAIERAVEQSFKYGCGAEARDHFFFQGYWSQSSEPGRTMRVSGSGRRQHRQYHHRRRHHHRRRRRRRHHHHHHHYHYH